MRNPLQALDRAPEELTRGRLKRIGEGVGKVVYASEHWVVKRDRGASEIIALILIWRLLKRLERVLPRRLAARWTTHPSTALRLLRVAIQAVVSLVPRALWFSTHWGRIWQKFVHRDVRGEYLAVKHLAGTSLVPETVTFPPTLVKVSGWPGWLVVTEATERVEETLYDRLKRLAAQRRWNEVERWLERLLELRRAGWRRGVFSVDAHLKNFGVIESRVVLLDAGGLTDRWEDVDRHLSSLAQNGPPSQQFGLAEILRDAPELAARFDARWREVADPRSVRDLWPAKGTA
ncbi:MAG: hypothetical protein ACP5UT_11850 [Bryobacteraceae bacterium]